MTPAGVSPTRYSWVLISAGTPIFISPPSTTLPTSLLITLASGAPGAGPKNRTPVKNVKTTATATRNQSRRITMKRWLRSGVLAATMLAGCAGLKVELDYDPARNFGAYHSYAWLPAATSKEGEALVRNDLVE